MSPIGFNVVDGIIGFVSQQSKGKKKNSKITQTVAIQDTPYEIRSSKTISKINVVESSTSETKSTRGKNNGKGKSQQNSSSKEKPAKTNPNYEKQKPCYPCLICNKYHYSREFPHQAEVSKSIRGSPTSNVLKD